MKKRPEPRDEQNPLGHTIETHAKQLRLRVEKAVNSMMGEDRFIEPER